MSDLLGPNVESVMKVEVSKEWCMNMAKAEIASDTAEQLHTFLNAAAGDGLVLDGVDAADLYVALFPERYAATIAGLGA